MRFVLEIFPFLLILSFFSWTLWIVVISPSIKTIKNRYYKHLKKSPWKVEETSDGINTEVWLEHPTEKPILIDEVSAHLPAWEHQERLEELRVKAQQLADDKNRR